MLRHADRAGKSRHITTVVVSLSSMISPGGAGESALERPCGAWARDAERDCLQQRPSTISDDRMLTPC
jgi:hypothetical protein